VHTGKKGEEGLLRPLCKKGYILGKRKEKVMFGRRKSGQGQFLEKKALSPLGWEKKRSSGEKSNFGGRKKRKLVSIFLEKEWVFIN